MTNIQGIMPISTKDIDNKQYFETTDVGLENAQNENPSQNFDKATKILGDSSRTMFFGSQKIQQNLNTENKTAKVQEASEKLPYCMPKYLYHMTTRENYEKILKSGKMHGSKLEEETGNLKGIYMVSKDNFLKKWCGTPTPVPFELDGTKPIDLGENLIRYTSIGGYTSFEDSPEESKMVAIQIPTSSLDLSKMRFRPVLTTTKETFHALEHNEECVLGKHGLPLCELPNYIDKEPVEFIYQDDMPIDLFSKTTCADADESRPYINIANDLFN